MSRPPPITTLTDTLCPYTTLFLSDKARLEALREEADRLEDQWAGENEIPDEVAARIQAIDEEIAPLVSKPLIYDAAEVAIAGAFVSIDVDGSLHVERGFVRSEEHTSELQSLMRISYAVCCSNKKK